MYLKITISRVDVFEVVYLPFYMIPNKNEVTSLLQRKKQKKKNQQLDQIYCLLVDFKFTLLCLNHKQKQLIICALHSINGK